MLRWDNNRGQQHRHKELPSQFLKERTFYEESIQFRGCTIDSSIRVCCGALILSQKVNAAGEGKITGTVKLDGAAPHMKGIDMSKDPYCSKAHATDPAHLETYVTGANGGLENVVLYISDWSGTAQTINRGPGIRSKKLHVHPARVGHGCRPDVQGGHQ